MTKIWGTRAEPQPQYVFEPLKDITAYELALVIKRIFPPITSSGLTRVPKEIQRHLVEVKK